MVIRGFFFIRSVKRDNGVCFFSFVSVEYVVWTCVSLFTFFRLRVDEVDLWFKLLLAFVNLRGRFWLFLCFFVGLEWEGCWFWVLG